MFTKEFLYEQYVSFGKSGYQIAKELCVSKHTVENAITKFGIPRRRLKESRVNKDSKNLPGHRWCNTCRSDLPILNFSYASRSSDNLSYICRSCATARARKYHKGNNESRQRRKSLVILNLGNKCLDCGLEDLPIDAFVFHHHSERMTHKDYILPNKVISQNNPELLSREMKKWILLCANCHSVRHGSGVKATKYS